MRIRLAAHFFIGILLGIVFWDIGDDAAKIQSNTSCLFFFLLFLFFANAMPSVLACEYNNYFKIKPHCTVYSTVYTNYNIIFLFGYNISVPLETMVFYREHLNNYYSLGVYFVSKLVSDLPLIFIGPTSFILGAYYMTGQPEELNRFLMIWAVCLLTTILAHLTGLISGCAFSMQVGNFVVPVSTIPMLIFSGFFIKFSELVDCLKPMTYISYFRYAFEGSVQAIYGFNRTNLECSETFCYYRNINKFLTHMDMIENKYWMDLSALGIWIVSLIALLFLTLKIKLIRNQ